MRRSALPAAILASMVTCSQQSAGAVSVAPEGQVQVQAIRVGFAPEKTRLTLDLSGPVSYRVSTLANPDRVLIELPGVSGLIDPPSVPLQGTSVKQITSEKRAPGILTYVINVVPGTTTQAFTLKPFEGRGDRLVVDLHTSRVSPPISSDLKAPEVVAATTAPASSQIGGHTAPTEALGTAAASSASEPPDYLGEWSGYVSIETRQFFQSPAFPNQKDQDYSLAFEPEYYVDWADGEQQFGFSPFLRYDTADDQRTHADIREFYWRLAHDRWMVKLGVDVVFWGVTESQHLVDIINQTDLVENIDGEEKLGQPMVNIDYLSDWGNWQFYLLPYFRERTFPGKHGRLRTDPAVDTRNPEYESGSKQEHVDFALRWSHNIGDWDIGLAQFSGTSREPLLLLSSSNNGKTRIVPQYLQIDQTSLDVQTTKGAWLWKLEAIYNDNTLDNYYAYVAGFEYTAFGVAGTTADLGYLVEYNYDERGDRSTSALQDDIYLGLRLTGNDVASTVLLAGISLDTDTHAVVGNIEASRRLTEAWSVGLELRFFSSNTSGTDGLDFVNSRDDLYFIKDDDYIGIALSRYF